VKGRLLQVVPIVILSTFVVFGLLQLVPGDPAYTLAGEVPDPETVQRIRKLYELDQPWLLRYGSWLWSAAQGDLSSSIYTREPVSEMLWRAFPHTLLIVVYALLLATVLGVVLGVIAAANAGRAVDTVITGIVSIGISMPNFWIAMILVSTFALGFQIFPATGAIAFSKDPLEAIRYATLPALALASSGVAEVTRQLRSTMVEFLGATHVRTLYAKGLPMSNVLWKHGLRNVAVNLLTIIGLQFNRLLAATVIVETVFAFPGVGGAVIHAATNKDFPVVQGVVFLLVLIVLAVNLAVDLLCAAVDPRIGRR